MNRRKLDVAFSSILIIVSLIILTSDGLVEGGMETDLGSMFLPRIVAGFILLFSATIGIQSLIRIYKGVALNGLERIDTEGFRGIGIYVAIFIVYWLVVPHVGFLVATPFALFGIAVLLGGRQWIRITAVSLITPVVVYYACSNLLRVFLPPWALT